MAQKRSFSKSQRPLWSSSRTVYFHLVWPSSLQNWPSSSEKWQIIFCIFWQKVWDVPICLNDKLIFYKSLLTHDMYRVLIIRSLAFILSPLIWSPLNSTRNKKSSRIIWSKKGESRLPLYIDVLTCPIHYLVLVWSRCGTRIISNYFHAECQIDNMVRFRV